MVKLANDYGERTCLECQKKFTVMYPAQITCSPACQKKRKARFDAAWQRQARKSLWEKNKELKAQVAQLEAELQAAQKAGTEQLMPLREELAAAKGEIARLQDELKAAKEEAAHAKEELAKALKAAAAPKKSGKYAKDGPSFCPRLSMVGPGLPCGEMPECFKQSVCKHVPDGATVPAA